MREPGAFESRVQDAYDRWASEMPTDLDVRAFVRVTRAEAVPGRPVWRPVRPGNLRLAAIGAAAVLVAAVGIGAFLSRPQGIAPAASQSSQVSAIPSAGATESPSPSMSPETQPTALPSPSAPSDAPFVVFLRQLEGEGLPRGHLWAIRADGSDARELWPEAGLSNLAWSQDGTRLLMAVDYRIYLAEVSDVIGPFVDTGLDTGGATACNDKSREPHPCQDWTFTFAPDGERIAFHQTCTYSLPGCNFITTLDLRTGERTELAETLRHGRYPLADPAWSPDGSRIAFTRESDQRAYADGGVPDSDLYVIDADGQDLRQIDLGGVRATAPSWSTDGTAIAFMSETWAEETDLERDIYTIRADGDDLRRLTTDGVSAWPEWMLSDRIRFTRGERFPDIGTFWLMDADGGNAAQYADLGDAIEAIEPPGRATNIWGDPFVWQPAP
jgi:sugar lactone lactonase YvrE